jgi:hypothetical protein
MKLLNRIYPYFAIVGSILLVTKIVLNKVLIVYLDYDLGNYNKIATIIIDIIILMFGIGLLNDKSIDNKRYWKTILLIFFVQIMVRYPFIVKGNFIEGPTPLFRDTLETLERGFSLQDGNYLSARWPGDAYNFSIQFSKMLSEKTNS